MGVMLDLVFLILGLHDLSGGVCDLVKQTRGKD